MGDRNAMVGNKRKVVGLYGLGSTYQFVPFDSKFHTTTSKILNIVQPQQAKFIEKFLE